MKVSVTNHPIRENRRPARDAGLGFFQQRPKKSLTPCQARGDGIGG
jgi:hypothetical protein